MEELLLIAVVIFVVYSYVKLTCKTKCCHSDKKDLPAESLLVPETKYNGVTKADTETEANIVEMVSNEAGAASEESITVDDASETVSETVAETIIANVAVETDKSGSISDEVKNPKTGEVSKIPTAYRFAKRWIKEALVEEGFLDKVYKVDELNDEVNALIQEAFKKLKAMQKYN